MQSSRPLPFASTDPAYGSSVVRSRTWFTCFVLTTGPATDFSRPIIGLRVRNFSNACGALCIAAIRKSLPSISAMFANWAAQMRVAFASVAWNTGSSSPGDELMMRKTSAVAVCCSSNRPIRRCAAVQPRTVARSR